MKASRKRPKVAYRWSFGLLLFGSVLMPKSIGYQDLAALIARQPAVTERWRTHVRHAAFGTIQATFSFPRPMGSSIPDPYFTQLAALDPRALDVTGSIPLPSPLEPQAVAPRYEFPLVQRRLKGDRLPLATAPQPQVAPQQQPESKPVKLKDQASLISELKPAPRSVDPTLDAQQPTGPVARKGDREALPQPASEAPALPLRPEADLIDQAAAASETAAGAVRAVNTIARNPVPVAEQIKPAKVETASQVRKSDKPSSSVRNDAALIRAAGASVKVASASRAAGAVKRPAESAAMPAGDEALELAAIASDLTARTVQSAYSASLPQAPAAVAAKPVPKGSETSAANIVAVQAPTTEIADMESARADLKAPLGSAEVVAAARNSKSLSAASASKQADRFDVVDSLVQYSSAGPQSSRIYFGTHEIGFGQGSIQRWQADEAPTVLAPPHVDPEIKRAAADPQPEVDAAASGGETVAAKGEVTGEGRRPHTPAERLNLVGASRAKHERCLANAIYFEARGEVERGQMAVAQVIQFTFACDNVRDVVREPESWETASRIARDALDGKFWLPEVGKATHYHATYVNPWWVRTMTKHARLGIHIFYRPKRWGDGGEMPIWGDRLDVTGSITPMSEVSDREASGKRAASQPARLRSIFDPVEEIKPGG